MSVRPFRTGGALPPTTDFDPLRRVLERHRRRLYNVQYTVAPIEGVILGGWYSRYEPLSNFDVRLQVGACIAGEPAVFEMNVEGPWVAPPGLVAFADAIGQLARPMRSGPIRPGCGRGKRKGRHG